MVKCWKPNSKFLTQCGGEMCIQPCYFWAATWILDIAVIIWKPPLSRMILRKKLVEHLRDSSMEPKCIFILRIYWNVSIFLISLARTNGKVDWLSYMELNCPATHFGWRMCGYVNIFHIHFSKTSFHTEVIFNRWVRPTKSDSFPHSTKGWGAALVNRWYLIFLLFDINGWILNNYIKWLIPSPFQK